MNRMRLESWSHIVFTLIFVFGIFCGSVLVYQWSDINSGWNGKDKSEGTYYYVISYTDIAGKSQNKNGFLQLQR